MIAHYRNLSSNTLTNEKWLPILYYEDHYQVSNLGRVKSIDRYVEHPRLGQQFVKGKVLRQKVNKDSNQVSNQPSVSLQVALSKDGKTKYYNVRRLVYSAFVDPEIQYDSDRLCIINKNGNGYDCRLKNLKAVTIIEKTKRIFRRGRAPESYLKTADRTKWQKPYGGKVRMKAVEMLSLNGKVLKTFESIRQASRLTGVGEKEIINVAKGVYSQWNGRVWRYKAIG